MNLIPPRETLAINARANKNTVETTNWNTELVYYIEQYAVFHRLRISQCQTDSWAVDA